jgi:hypothetical protein
MYMYHRSRGPLRDAFLAIRERPAIESALDRVVAFPYMTQQLGRDNTWVRGHGNGGGVRAPPALLLFGSENV